MTQLLEVLSPPAETQGVVNGVDSSCAKYPFDVYAFERLRQFLLNERTKNETDLDVWERSKRLMKHLRDTVATQSSDKHINVLLITHF